MRLTHVLNKIVDTHYRLSETEAETFMDTLLTVERDEENTFDSCLSGLLIALRMRGETVAELTGFARSLRKASTPVTLGTRAVIDTCGTGGDGGKSFNVSTAVALVLASLEIPVLKHGNRAVSSASGSADVLEALGLPLLSSSGSVAQSLQQHHFGFCYAPAFHPAMKKVARARRALKTRTVFNLLGPLCNPGQVSHQVLGVFHKSYINPLAEVLKNLGSVSALVLSSEDGMDELSLNSTAYGVYLNNGKLRPLEFTPEQAGLRSAPIAAVQGGNAQHNARILQAIFAGEGGQLQAGMQDYQSAPRDLVLYNTAAALMVYGVVRDLRLGVSIATDAIDKGAVQRTLSHLQAQATTDKGRAA